MSNICDRLLEERKRLGFGQDEFSVRGGVAKRTYCNYESGERDPGATFLSAIATIGADVQYIVTGVRAQQAPAPAGLNLARLQLAIETVDEGLQATKRTMASSKKAELVLAVYDMFSDGAGAKEKDRILRVVKSAV